MYSQTGTLLSTLSDEAIKEWVDSFDTVLFDCDGVLWIFTEIIEGSVDVVNQLKKLGKNIFFVTNNSTKTRAEFIVKAKYFNFDVDIDNVVSTAYLCATYLKKIGFSKKVYIIGSKAIATELDDVGISHTGVGPDILKTTMYQFIETDFEVDPDVGAVVVGFDEHFCFPKMIRAASYLSKPDCLFISTNTDERFPMPGLVVPGTGSIVRAIETCSERKSTIMGKPESYLSDFLKQEYNIDPKRTLMVGDRSNTDILLGTRCGFQTLLVETGIHNRNDVEQWLKSDNIEDKMLVPDIIVPKLGDLLSHLV